MPTPRQKLRNLWLFLSCLVFVGLTACSGLKTYRDPDFAIGQLTEHGLGIGGVTGLGGGEHPLVGRVEESLISNIQRQLNLQTVPVRELKPLFSSDAYHQFLRSFSEIAEVGTEDFETLIPARERVRFLLFANISADMPQQSESVSEIIHTRTEKNRETGEREEVYDYSEYETTRVATRYVNMQFVLCDLERRKVVWSTTFPDDSGSSSRSVSRWPGSPPPWPVAPGNVEMIDAIITKTVPRL